MTGCFIQSICSLKSCTGGEPEKMCNSCFKKAVPVDDLDDDQWEHCSGVHAPFDPLKDLAFWEHTPNKGTNQLYRNGLLVSRISCEIQVDPQIFWQGCLALKANHEIEGDGNIQWTDALDGGEMRNFSTCTKAETLNYWLLLTYLCSLKTQWILFKFG